MPNAKTRAGSDVTIIHETEEYLFGFYDDLTYGKIPIRWHKNGIFWHGGARQSSLDLVEYNGRDLTNNQ